MLGPNYFNKVCANLQLDGQCRYEQERAIPNWLKTYLNEEIQKLNDLMQLAVKTRNPSAAHIISRCEEQQLILLQILDLEDSS